MSFLGDGLSRTYGETPGGHWAAARILAVPFHKAILVPVSPDHRSTASACSVAIRPRALQGALTRVTDEWRLGRAWARGPHTRPARPQSQEWMLPPYFTQNWQCPPSSPPPTYEEVIGQCTSEGPLCVLPDLSSATIISLPNSPLHSPPHIPVRWPDYQH